MGEEMDRGGKIAANEVNANGSQGKEAAMPRDRVGMLRRSRPSPWQSADPKHRAVRGSIVSSLTEMLGTV